MVLSGYKNLLGLVFLCLTCLKLLRAYMGIIGTLWFPCVGLSVMSMTSL